MSELCTITTPHEGHPVSREPLPPGWCPGVPDVHVDDPLCWVVGPSGGRVCVRTADQPVCADCPAGWAEPSRDGPEASGRGDGTTTGPQAATASPVDPAVARVLDAAWEMDRALRLVSGVGGPLSRPGKALVAAFDAMGDPAVCGAVQRVCDLPPGHQPADFHHTGRTGWRQDPDGDHPPVDPDAPPLTELAGSVPDFTGGVDAVAYVKSLHCPHHDDPAVCAAAQEADSVTGEVAGESGSRVTRDTRPSGGSCRPGPHHSAADDAANAPNADVDAPNRGTIEVVPLADHPAVSWLAEHLTQVALEDGAEEVDGALRGWLDDRQATGLDAVPASIPTAGPGNPTNPDSDTSLRRSTAGPDQEPDSGSPTAGRCSACGGDLVRRKDGNLHHRSGSPLCAVVHFRLDPDALREALPSTTHQVADQHEQAERGDDEVGSSSNGPGWHAAHIEHLAAWLEDGEGVPPLPPEMAAEVRALLADRDRVGREAIREHNRARYAEEGRNAVGRELAELRESLDGCVWVSPDRMSGQPCLGGTRLSASIVAGLAADGMSGEQIRESYPSASDAGVAAAVAFTRWLAAVQADALDHAAYKWRNSRGADAEDLRGMATEVRALAAAQADAFDWLSDQPLSHGRLRQWAAELRAGRLSIPTDTEEE
jgi:uncharacterized protein (DUF433 family)